MKFSTSIWLLFVAPTLLFQLCQSTTIVVDGVSEWKDPSVHVGDSVIFKHKESKYSVYIFQNLRAFNACNLSHATLLSKPNSTYTWHPSRPGMFYFTFSKGRCEIGTQRMAIKVWNSSKEAEAPGNENEWPKKPEEKEKEKGKGGIQFINSNPAVPLPTGQVDSPLPISLSPRLHVMMDSAIICCMLPLFL